MSKKFNVHDMLEDVDLADVKNCEIEKIKLENCEPGDCFLIEPETETVLVVGFRDFTRSIVEKTCEKCAEGLAKMMVEIGDDGTVSELVDLMQETASEWSNS